MSQIRTPPIFICLHVFDDYSACNIHAIFQSINQARATKTTREYESQQVPYNSIINTYDRRSIFHGSIKIWATKSHAVRCYCTVRCYLFEFVFEDVFLKKSAKHRMLMVCPCERQDDFRGVHRDYTSNIILCSYISPRFLNEQTTSCITSTQYQFDLLHTCLTYSRLLPLALCEIHEEGKEQPGVFDGGAISWSLCACRILLVILLALSLVWFEVL